MDDGRLPYAWEAMHAERTADVGWEPPAWEPVLRERRRAEWRDVGKDLVVFLLVLPLLGLEELDSPWRVGFWLAGPLLLVVLAWWPHSSAERRERWERQTRREVRIEHALGHHVSIGAADRELVTEQAEKIDTWAEAHFLGWPVLAVVCLAAVGTDPELAGYAKWIWAIGLLTICAVQFLRARRRLQWALRWLDDPLPRPVSRE